MRKRTTIDDVAREAGVSRQTVSRAINGMDGISETTRERVMDTVNELGYRPSRLAQGMASNQTHTIGLVISNITNPAQAQVVRGIQDVAVRSDTNVFLRNTDHSKEKERESIRSLVSEKVDGIILLNSRLEDEELIQFANANCPIVLVHRRLAAENISSIVTDVERTTKTVIRYLIGSGHHSIGLVTRQGSYENNGHIQGFLSIMAAIDPNLSGLRPDRAKNWIIQEEVTLEGGYRAALKLLTRSPELSAIFAYNDLMGIGAIRACHELGRDLPTSTAIFGYGDIAWCSFVSPPLSSVRIQGHDLGRQAMERLIEMIGKPDTIFSPIVLDIELVFRESSDSIASQ